MKHIIILGSTGSIGTQTLDVIRANPDEFCVIGLSAHKNTELFEKQTHEFKPKHMVLTSMSENPNEALSALASAPDADLVVNAISGTSGLTPTFAACKAGKKIALANKESFVMAGELIMDLAGKTGAQILPIDSEMNAIWQIICHAEPVEACDIEKIILTASGGPFWKWKRNELERVTAAQALKHPTWKMGEKISVDSATLMNKAFEIIEARWLFDIPPEKIDVVIHRQSTVHALVQFCDGNTQAILSTPDMRIPISYVLFYPIRPSHSKANSLTRPKGAPLRAQRAPSNLNLSELTLTFEKPDYSIFEGPRLAYEVLEAGGIMPAAFCLADEIAVQKFLKGEISFLGIYDFIKRALERVKNMPLSMEALTELPDYL